jgi:hypothetical protein
MVTHHYDATYFIGHPIQEMYVEQPGDEKMSGMYMFIY